MALIRIFLGFTCLSLQPKCCYIMLCFKHVVWCDAKIVSFLLVPALLHKKLLLILSSSGNALYSEEVHVDFGSDIHHDFLWCIWLPALAERLPRKNSEEQLEGSHGIILCSEHSVFGSQITGVNFFCEPALRRRSEKTMAVGVLLCAPQKDKDFMLFPTWYHFLAQPPHPSPWLPAASSPTPLTLSVFLWGARLSRYLTV